MWMTFLLEKFKETSDQIALMQMDADQEVQASYQDILDYYQKWSYRLDQMQISSDAVIAVLGDYCLSSIGLMLAIIDRGCVYVPLSTSIKNIDHFLEIAEVSFFIDLKNDTINQTTHQVQHALIDTLNQQKRPGLILFSSGSTGAPKAAIHDLVPMIERYKTAQKPFTSIAFLLFDHIGGFNTLMFSLSSNGTIICPNERSPEHICQIIEKYHIQVLPTSPTFLNMLLISRAYDDYDLSSLKVITYGTEPMPQSTLTAFHEVLPNVRMKQTYGLSEVGILRTQSENSSSLWMKVGGDETHQVKIVDETLWIKSKTSMLGYLNAPSPFDAEGWMNTQDKVEKKGDYIRILGRQSEIINVGGEKVYPSEVESVILELPEVSDVIIKGEKNPVIGHVVTCHVAPMNKDIDVMAFKSLIKRHCEDKLERFKRPVRISISKNGFSGERFKRVRK